MRLGALTTTLLLAAASIAPAFAADASPPAAAPRKDQMLLHADEVVYDTDHAVTTARGHIEIDYKHYILMSDSVTYDENADKVVASGHVTLMEPDGNVAFSDQATLTNQMRDGVLQGFAALIGNSGRLAGTGATRQGGVRTIATRAVYSNCKVCNQPGQRTPVWQVEARRVVYDEQAHRIFYNDAIVDLFGVPVLYTPFFTHPDPTIKRASGILMPEFGNSSTLGYYGRIPIYISLSDSRDFTIAPLFTSRNGNVLEGEYRERWNEGGFWLQPSVAENPHGGLNNNQFQIYSSLFGSGLFPISDTWHAGFQAQLTSNKTYLERYKISQADRLVSDVYVEGISGRSRFAITGYFFQGLVKTDNNSQYPIPLPLIEYSYVPEGDLFGGQFRFDLNSVAISRRVGEDDQRLTGEVNWKVPFVTGNGQLFTFAVDARGDIYHIDDPQASAVPTRHFISRGLPYAAIDWRWPFVTESESGRTSYVFEPIAQIIAAPYGGNPVGIPNEDSSDFQFDETDIFSFHRLPGYDIVETGPRANVGFRTQAIYPTGSVELLMGQEFRLKPDPIFAKDSGVSGTQSDLVSRLTVNFLPHLSVTERVDLDTKHGTLSRNEVYVDAYYGRSSLELSYLKLPHEEVTLGLPTREEVNGQAQLGLSDYWLLYASAQRNLADGTMIAAEFGFGYEDECLGVSLSYRRQYTTDQDIPPSTDFLVRFNLKTGNTPSDRTQLFPQHLYSHIAL